MKTFIKVDLEAKRLGSNIYIARKRRNMSLVELSAKSSVSKTVLRRIESGESHFRPLLSNPVKKRRPLSHFSPPWVAQSRRQKISEVFRFFVRDPAKRPFFHGGYFKVLQETLQKKCRVLFFIGGGCLKKSPSMEIP